MTVFLIKTHMEEDNEPTSRQLRLEVPLEGVTVPKHKFQSRGIRKTLVGELSGLSLLGN